MGAILEKVFQWWQGRLEAESTSVMRPEPGWSQWEKKGKTTCKYWKVRKRASRNWAVGEWG